MALHTSTTEKGIRSNGRDPMRNMFGNLRPIVCSFTEETFCDLDSRPSGSSVALPNLPPADRSERTRSDVPDDHDDNFYPPGYDIYERSIYLRARVDSVLERQLKLEKEVAAWREEYEAAVEKFDKTRLQSCGSAQETK